MKTQENISKSQTEYIKKLEEFNNKLFKIAYLHGSLENYLRGVEPYSFDAAKIGTIINTGATIGHIYKYYLEYQDENVPKAVAAALANLAQQKSFLSAYAVAEIITYHLSRHKKGQAPFEIDCTPILELLQLNLEENKDFYSQPAELGGYSFKNGIYSHIYKLLK